MLNQKLRTAQIITAAMMMAGLMYTVVLFVAEGPSPGDDLSALNLGLLASAFGVMVAILPIRRMQMGTLALMPQRLRETDTRLPSQQLSQEIGAALGRYTNGTLISMAMAESIILFGFVQAWLNQEPLRVLPFLLAGELIMVLLFPRRSIFETLLSAEARSSLSASEREGVHPGR